MAPYQELRDVATILETVGRLAWCKSDASQRVRRVGVNEYQPATRNLIAEEASKKCWERSQKRN